LKYEKNLIFRNYWRVDQVAGNTTLFLNLTIDDMKTNIDLGWEGAGG